LAAAIQRAFYEGAREHLQLAFALLLYTGQRRGDVCRMRWTDIEDVKDGEQWLAVVQEKTGETVPVLLHSVLRRAIMRHARERKSEFILATPTGKRYDKGWLTKVIQARLVEIGQPKSKYTLHGLRKAAAVLLAESGATVEQLMSVMSWKTPTQAIYYCREANNKTLNRAAWAFLDKEAA
jgi:integrase